MPKHTMPARAAQSCTPGPSVVACLWLTVACEAARLCTGLTLSTRAHPALQCWHSWCLSDPPSTTHLQSPSGAGGKQAQPQRSHQHPGRPVHPAQSMHVRTAPGLDGQTRMQTVSCQGEHRWYDRQHCRRVQAVSESMPQMLLADTCGHVCQRGAAEQRSPASEGGIPIYRSIITQVRGHMGLIPQPGAQPEGQVVWAARTSLRLAAPRCRSKH